MKKVLRANAASKCQSSYGQVSSVRRTKEGGLQEGWGGIKVELRLNVSLDRMIRAVSTTASGPSLAGLGGGPGPCRT